MKLEDFCKTLVSMYNDTVSELDAAEKIVRLTEILKDYVSFPLIRFEGKDLEFAYAERFISNFDKACTTLKSKQNHVR